MAFSCSETVAAVRSARGYEPGESDVIRRWNRNERRPTYFAGGSTKMGHESETNDNAILKLMVEFRQLWIEQGAARSGPSASSSSTPPRPEAARRIHRVAFILIVCAAMASAYLFGEILARSSGVSVHLPSVSRVDKATRPTARISAMRTPAPSRLPVAAEQTSTPAPPMRQSQTPPAASYHLQIGAFNVLEYAQDLERQLRSHDYVAMIVDVPTGPPHRVWIIGVFDRPTAERLADRLRNDGFEAILLRQ